MPLDGNVIELLGTESPTDADYNSKVGALLASNDSLDTENVGLKEQVTELKAKVSDLDALKEKAELGEKYLTDTREVALAAHKRAKGDDASDGMEKTIASADLDQALALKTMFETEADKKFPLKCEGCGATQLTRRSSQEEAEEAEGQETGKASDHQIR